MSDTDDFIVLIAAAEDTHFSEQKVQSNVAENKSRLDSGIEELLKDFQWNTPPVVGKPLNNMKNDTMSLTEKVYDFFEQSFEV